MEMTKEVTIGSRNFQIGRMSARNGSWIFTKVVESDGDLSEQDFRRIQDICLAACKEIKTVTNTRQVVPVILESGEFVDKELEYDIATIVSLVVETRHFNLDPVFRGDGLELIKKTFQGQPSSSTQA